MPSISRCHILSAVLAAVATVGVSSVTAQSVPDTSARARTIARRLQLERSLDSIAVIERKVMIPMRDGTRIQIDVYRPKGTDKAPALIYRHPYNMNYWDVPLGAPADMSLQLGAVRRGYAYIAINDRGRFFSEGEWDILGPPRTDGVDEIHWISSQPWSHGKVGLFGCSSAAEWQMGVAALAPKGLAAINPQGFGAGIGRMGPFYEQGNWYRGGAVQLLFAHWMWGNQNNQRPMFPANTSREDMVRLSKYFDLDPQMPATDWVDAFKHLPEEDMIRYVDGPRGAFADSMPVATGGRMIQRTPNDPAWYKGGLYHDDMVINVPGLWFMSWYDVSIGPNLEVFKHVMKTARPEIAKQQYAVIAPTLHCQYTRATENTVVGERSVGDARLNYDSLMYGWFDHFLKGDKNGLLDTLPRVRYYTMGSNKWQSSDSWPPKGAKPVTYYLTSGGKANTLNGDGKLVRALPSANLSDSFTYDPANPVPSHGGNVCCQGTFLGGAMDQQKMEMRPDILVYTTDPLGKGIEVSGPVGVMLYVSSDTKDTDFTVKLLDVYPDGRAYNLDESIQRVRYRDGYDKQVWMQPGKVYKVALGPLNTSNYFDAGHRIRIEISSSNFPRF
ncbi:MAG: CocE/NonD family hydrolase, partial [Gemmatimonadaceae bacterium]